MNALITHYGVRRSSGYGQYTIYGTVNGRDLTIHSTDSKVFDWWDDDSDEEMHQEALEHIERKLMDRFEEEFGY